MMKVMILQPAKGKTKTEEQLREDRIAAVKRLNREEYEVIDIVVPDYSKDTEAKHLKFKRLAYLLDIISRLDGGVYFTDGWEKDLECSILRKACFEYHSPIITFEVRKLSY